MKKEIIIEVETPVDCTDDQFEEWAKFELGYAQSMSLQNPLEKYDLQASDMTIR